MKSLKVKKVVVGLTIASIICAFGGCNQSAKKTSWQELSLQKDERTGKYGYANEKGKFVISPKYDEVKNFSDGFAQVYIGELPTYRGNGKWGIINADGDEIVPCKYDRIEDFKEGLACVYIGKILNGRALNGKWGFIDTAGVEVIPLKYDYASGFSEDLAVVNIGAVEHTRQHEVAGYSIIGGIDGGKYGYIDKAGKEVIPLKFDLAYDFSGGKAEVSIYKQDTIIKGVIDKTGEYLSQPVETTFIAYACKKELDNGLTLTASFTLKTTGDNRAINGYEILIGRGNMTNYKNVGKSEYIVEADGTFSTNGDFSGQVKANKVECMLTRIGGEKITFTAFPKKK